MINPNKLCPGCMNELTGESGICSKCGFDISQMNVNPRCLPPYTVLAGKYLLGKVLGEGGFGITYLGWDLNLEMKVAIKEYFPTGLATRDTTNMTTTQLRILPGNAKGYFDKGLLKYTEEAKLLSRFSHEEGIVSVKDYIYENGTAYIVMEYIEGRSLREEMSFIGKTYSEEQMLPRIMPILHSLEKVHAAEILHRDISPDNIMIAADGQVRLIDFGSARVATGDDNKSLTIMLKHGYAPEEQYRTRGIQGPWTDVYSICATMYRMLTGTVPEDAMDRLYQDKLRPVCECQPDCSQELSNVIMKGLSVRAEKRYQSAAELQRALIAATEVPMTASATAPITTSSTAVMSEIRVMDASQPDSITADKVDEFPIDSTETTTNKGKIVEEKRKIVPEWLIAAEILSIVLLLLIAYGLTSPKTSNASVNEETVNTSSTIDPAMQLDLSKMANTNYTGTMNLTMQDFGDYVVTEEGKYYAYITDSQHRVN